MFLPVVQLSMPVCVLTGCTTEQAVCVLTGCTTQKAGSLVTWLQYSFSVPTDFPTKQTIT